MERGSLRTIFPLPEDVIGQVAAGEVIERPASVIKELVENALDAGASEITIELQDAGKESIIVNDNGRGIDREDFPWLIARHATSKLKTTEELFSIHTLGFRGEALASVAAVSELTIQSKTPDQVGGWQVRWQNGQQRDEGPIGMDFGTRVEAKQIFSRFPARRKFLRQSATELRHILDVIAHQAMMHPEVKWQVSNNDQVILYLAPAEKKERLAAILGTELASQLLAVEHHLPHIDLQGWIGRPPLGTSRPLHQYIFVNNRPVSNHLVKQIIRNNYQHYLDPRSYPVFCVFLTLPTEMVDIHLHPRKETVRFLNEKQIMEIFNQAIESALKLGNELDTLTRHQHLIADANTQSQAGKVLKKLVLDHKLGLEPTAEPILQIQDLYLAVSTSEGLLLIDQHAAHERILYEQYRAAFEQQQKNTTTFTLERPLLWQASVTERALLEEHQAELEELHFRFEIRKQSEVAILAVPAFLQDRNVVELLRGILSDFVELPQQRSIDTPSQLMLAYLACRSAIKGGEYLEPERRIELLTELSTYPANYTCPHGRPVQVVLNENELAKLFHRV
jgi:DNA mismatch repair protein MutL